MRKHTCDMMVLRCLLAVLFAAWFSAMTAHAQDKSVLELKPIIEKHAMIPMRDGKHLSAYLYFPPGKGPWPVVFEQR